MSRFREKAEAQTKQIIGQMLGDEQLVEEGKEESRNAEAGPASQKPVMWVVLKERGCEGGALLVRRAHEDQLVEFLERFAVAEKFRRQPVEQFRMRRR